MRLLIKIKSLIKSRLKRFIDYEVIKFFFRKAYYLDQNNLNFLLDSLWYNKLLRPKKKNIDKKKKILLIAPHPDDEVIGCGGTLLKFTKIKSDISIVYITLGSNDKKKKELRKKEAHKVCAKMGWNYYFLNHNLNYKSWDNLEFTKIINKIKPDIIFTPSIFDDNIEHKNSNFFICESISKTSSEIWLYQVYTSHIANTLIDITEEIKMKQKIIKIYNSQMRTRDWAHFSLGLNAWNSRFLGTKGKKAWVEAFLVVNSQFYKKYINEFRKNVKEF